MKRQLKLCEIQTKQSNERTFEFVRDINATINTQTLNLREI